MFALAVAALGVQLADATFSSVMAKGGDICGGAPSAVEDGPKVWIGAANGKNCTDGDVATAPDEFVVLEFDHGCLIHENDTNATLYAQQANDLMDDLELNNDSLQFKAPEIFDVSGFQHATFSFGMETGDRATTGYAWGYFAMSASLALSGEMSIDTNNFWMVEPDGSVDDQGACISPSFPLGANTSCGAPVKVSPGHFKYSLFGYAGGSYISSELADMGWFGIRTKVHYSSMGMDASLTGLTFNGGLPHDQVCDQGVQVESIKLDGLNTSLEFAFPQYYNYGIREAGPPVTFTKRGSEQIQLRCQGGPAGQYFYIDYLFKTGNSTLKQEGGYFVYDPTLSSKDLLSGATSSTAMPSNESNESSTTSGDSSAVVSHTTARTASFAFFLALMPLTAVTSQLGAWGLA